MQARTGPDGALYIVDMYRFVIEHPRRIPPERLKELDVRAGADRGRIYRISAKNEPLRPVPDLTKFSGDQLVAAFNTRNGTLRDLIHGEFAKKTPPPRALASIAIGSPIAAVRAHALGVLTEKSPAPASFVKALLADPEPNVRRLALRAAEAQLDDPSLLEAALTLETDPDAAVRTQLAASLGETASPKAGAALALLAKENSPWMRAAVLSSSAPHIDTLVKNVIGWPASANRSELLGQLFSVIASNGDLIKLGNLVGSFAAQPENQTSLPGNLVLLLESMSRKGVAIEALLGQPEAGPVLQSAFVAARKTAPDVTKPVQERETAIRLVAREPLTREADVMLLTSLLVSPGEPAKLQAAALSRLKEVPHPSAATALIDGWVHFAPALRPQVMGVLLAREASTEAALKAARAGTIAPTEFSQIDRQRLLEDKVTSIRELASVLFVQNGSRGEALKTFAGVSSLAGQPMKGAAIFSRSCAACHAMRGLGHDMGPNLAEFRGKSVEDFLLAIIDPNAGINPNFIAYQIETKDGRSLSGLVRNETASGLTLFQAGGVNETLLRSSVSEIRASSRSLMPEGLEQGLSPQDMADLIAWLKQP